MFYLSLGLQCKNKRGCFLTKTFTAFKRMFLNQNFCTCIYISSLRYRARGCSQLKLFLFFFSQYLTRTRLSALLVKVNDNGNSFDKEKNNSTDMFCRAAIPPSPLNLLFSCFIISWQKKKKAKQSAKNCPIYSSYYNFLRKIIKWK